uniref:Zona pellucida sperm-binding protein 4 n=1 Tax=Hippocampus comes TaxID=109280 RepID=A0A3Q3D833_HIPCM
MANRWGVIFLGVFVLLVCFRRTELTPQHWQSSKNPPPQSNLPPQNPTGLNPFYPPIGPFATELLDPSHLWLSGHPGLNPFKDPGGQNNVKNPMGQNPVKHLGGQHPIKYPGGQTPVNNPPVWHVPQGQNPPNPGMQYPGQNPGGKYPYPGQNPGMRYPQNPGMQYPQNPGGQNPQNPGGQNPQNPGVQNPQNPGGQNPQNPGGQNPVKNPTGQNPVENSPGQNPVKVPGGQNPVKIPDWGVQHVPCGRDDISAEACEALQCCYNGGMCYFGKAVTVQCTKDAQFIVVVARAVTLPSIDLETFSLLGDGPGCMTVDSNSAFAIYQFPVTTCGTVVTEEPGMIIYENRMTSSYEVAMGPLGATTRDSSFDLLFQCRYRGTSVETIVAEIFQPHEHPAAVFARGPISVQLRLGNGRCLTKGCDEGMLAYNSYYVAADYPVTRILRDPVYVEVQLMDRSDANLVLNLGRCWATTSENPHSLPQWDILIDGCPNRDDRYTSSLVPVGPNSGLDFPRHYRRFSFQMFTFVDPNSLEPQKEQVYIHCSTSICNAGAGFSCEPSCLSRRSKEHSKKKK